MILFVVSFVVFVMAMAFMAVGVLLRRRPVASGCRGCGAGACEQER